MNKVMSNKKAIALYVLPAFILLAILVYVPIFLTGYYGMMKWDGIGEMNFVGLNNYLSLLQDGKFWYSARNSFILASVSSLALVGYLVISLVLSGKIKGSDTLRKIYLIPMLLSSVAIAQLWIKIYDPNNGMLNSLLTMFGVENPPAWLAQRSTVLIAIIIAVIWQYAGFYIIIYSSALKGIPTELVEAAQIDGANPIQIAMKVKVPLISGVIKTTIVLSLVGSLKYFDLIWVMTGGGPNGASEVIASYMYKEAFSNYNAGYGSAIGFALLILSFIVTVIIQKVTNTTSDFEY